MKMKKPREPNVGSHRVKSEVKETLEEKRRRQGDKKRWKRKIKIRECLWGLYFTQSKWRVDDS